MRDAIEAFRGTILAAVGYALEEIEPGRLHRFATSDRRSDDAGWCKLFDDMRGGVFGCHRQFPGQTFTWTAAARPAMTRKQRSAHARQVTVATAEREAQQRRQWADNAQRIAQVWAQCVPVTRGDSVSLYLDRRGLADVWPLPDMLRLHRAMPYWHEGEKLGTFPAMMAPIITPDGCTVALHRTHVTADGRKADVPVVKKLTGSAGTLAGACIRLHWPARGVLGVAEGIETALAASLASGVPTVAAYCASALAGFVWPAGVQRLVIFADNDRAGRESASELQSRAVRTGLAVNVMTPTDDGADWCDVWAHRGAVSIEGAAA